MIGLRNYVRTIQNTDNINAFGPTLVFLVATVSIELVLGMVAALVFTRNFAAKGF